MAQKKKRKGGPSPRVQPRTTPGGLKGSGERRPGRGMARRSTQGAPWAAIALSLAIGSTIVFLPDGQSRWVLPKLTVLAAAVAIGALAARRGRLPRWFIGVVLAGGVILAIAILASAAPWAQAWGRWPRYEGLIALPVYAATVWLGARVLGPHDRAFGLEVMRRASAVVAILLGGIAAVEAAGIHPIPSDISRPGSLTGTATDQGILGAILVAILVVPVVRRIRRRARDGEALLLAAGLVAALTAVVSSASRAGLVSLAAALIVAIGAEAIAVSRRATPGSASGSRFVVGTGAILAVGVSIAALRLPLTRARLVGGGGAVSPGLSDRPLIWREALTLAGQRPMLGWGPSGFEDAVAGVHGTDWYATMGRGVVLDSPHSGYLQVLLAGGVVLSLVSLGGLVWLGRTLLIRWNAATASIEPIRRADADLQAVAAAAAAALCAGLITSFTSVTIVAIPALLVGAAIAGPGGRAGTESRRSRRARRGLAAVLGAWAIFLAVATSAEVSLAQAETAAAHGDIAQTDRLLDQAEARRPWDVDVGIIGSEILAAAADHGMPGAADAAVTRAEAALGRAPESAQAALALAVAQTAQGAAGDATALSEAEKTLTALVERFPGDPVVAHRLAGVLILEGRLTDAERELVRATTIDPTDRDILLTLEYVYEVLGDDVGLADARDRLAALPAEEASAF